MSIEIVGMVNLGVAGFLGRPQIDVRSSVAPRAPIPPRAQAPYLVGDREKVTADLTQIGGVLHAIREGAIVASAHSGPVEPPVHGRCTRRRSGLNSATAVSVARATAAAT